MSLKIETVKLTVPKRGWIAVVESDAEWFISVTGPERETRRRARADELVATRAVAAACAIAKEAAR